MNPGFGTLFRELTDHTPRHYQTELAGLLAEGRLPERLDVPTGMGKTLAVLVSWVHGLLTDAAAAQHEGRPRRVPLRLHFAVDRRVVVDDSFATALRVAHALNSATSGPLADAASTLRASLSLDPGEPVLEVIRLRGGTDPEEPESRNRLTEHTRHPGRPAIIIGTLDMLVSRLLFRGYQLSPRRRSIDAALTGTDTWWVLDEAHLATQAYTTLRTIQDYEAPLESRFDAALPPFRVMAMTATHLQGAAPQGHASSNGASEDLLVSWDEAAEADLDPTLSSRLSARRNLPLRVTAGGDAELKKEAAALLPTLRTGDAAVVFCTKVSTAKAVFEHLRTKVKKLPVTPVLLTGGMPEIVSRERLQALAPFHTGIPERKDAPPVIVVATSTLEVGADLDFTHLITQSADAPALIQRLGRVNRIGSRTSGSVTVVCQSKDPIYGEAATAVATALQPCATLGEAVETLSSSAPTLHTPQQTPAVIPPAVLGAYVRTAGSRNDAPVGAWIRPLEDPRNTVTVVIRDDAALMDEANRPALLEGLSLLGVDARAEGWTVHHADLVKLSHHALVLDPSGVITPRAVHPGDKPRVPSGHILIVSPEDGALIVGTSVKDLSGRHLLTGQGASIEATQKKLDAESPTASAPLGPFLVELAGWDQTDSEVPEEAVADLRLPEGLVLDTTVLAADSEHPWLLLRFFRPAAQESLRPVELSAHESAVGELAGRWAGGIGLPSAVVADIRTAGYRHDEGKRADLFQQALTAEEGPEGFLSLSATVPEVPLAKSALPRRLWRRSRRLAGIPDGWAHEAASAVMLDDAAAAGADDLTVHDLELVRHLVLTHHGRFRGPGPLLEEPTTDDPYQCATAHQWSQQMLSFRELNRRYGPYTLSLAEAIVRLADWEVSRREQEASSPQHCGMATTTGPSQPTTAPATTAKDKEQRA